MSVLPIDSYIPAVRAAITEAASVIVKAEPGAGKTTRVPPAILDCVQGRILVLEPRRLAARLSAERVAAERGEATGRTVGYQIRFEAKTTAETRLVFATEGVFLRMALDQPTLTGISAVVLDEFHERHIHTDLALAVVRKLQAGPRPDLKLVVMSATLDTAALEAYLPEAKVFDVPGRTFPVAVEYLPFADDAPVEDSVQAGVRRALADPRSPGDILVFLTGIQEIRRCAARLAPLAAEAGADLLPLAADLPYKDQARVFERTSRRKIILATNVAETSLTLPGVTAVVDTGRAKLAGHASWSGMPTLDVKKVSQASCIQRAGRAGRVQSGVAYRLYSEADFRSRPPFTAPDIRRLDLAETYLDVLALSQALGDSPADMTSALPWFERPEPKSADSASQLLANLGALDGAGRLTPRGQKIARIPLHPRLAAIVVKGQEVGLAAPALAAACLISERMILSRGVSAVTHEDSDVHFQLDILTRLASGSPLSPRSLESAVDQGKVRQVASLYDNLASRLRTGPFPRQAGDAKLLGRCLLAGYPDRVAKRREVAGKDRPLYNLCLGRGAFLADSSVARGVDLILALDAAETQSRSADRGTAIYVAAGIDTDALLDSPAPLLGERRETVWSEDAQRVDVMERLTYGQLVVSETRAAVRPEHAAVIEELLRTKLAERWPKPFEDGSDLDAYHERAHLLTGRHPDAGFPKFEGEMLELLQAAISEGKRSFKEIAGRSLLSYIEEQLPYELRQLLAEGAPLELRLANGRRLRVTYETGRPPFVSGHIQDFYGIRSSPVLPGAATPVTVQLLGPNKRPVQVTADLAGFWQRSYPALKSELGRKYPRHYWPESPETAEPVLHKARVGKPQV